jgi:hypothetical protein
MGQLSHGNWGNRPSSVLQAIVGPQSRGFLPITLQLLLLPEPFPTGLDLPAGSVSAINPDRREPAPGYSAFFLRHFVVKIDAGKLGARSIRFNRTIHLHVPRGGHGDMLPILL